MNHIRAAVYQDIVRLAEIEIFNYRLNFYPIFRNDMYYFGDLRVDKLAQEYAENPEWLHNTLVYDDGVVKGFIRIDGCEVKKLFVEPSLQRQSIGSRILQYAIDQNKVSYLWALEKNTRALSFYARHGFYASNEIKCVDDTDELLVCLRRKSNEVTK